MPVKYSAFVVALLLLLLGKGGRRVVGKILESSGGAVGAFDLSFNPESESDDFLLLVVT